MSSKSQKNQSSGQKSARKIRNIRTKPNLPKSLKSGKGRNIIDISHESDNGGLNLGEATQLYARSLANPFVSGPSGACIPDAPALMTRRSKVFARGTFTTSNVAAGQGVGWIVMDPLSAFANDRPFVTFNTPNQPFTNIDIIGAQAASSFASSNSEYVQADLSAANLQARVVASGLKVRNITSLLQRGGFLTGLHEPGHTCINAFDIPTMDSYLESGRLSGADLNSDKWISLTYRPVDSDDLDFQTGFVNPGTGVANSTYMGFIVQAPDSTGANTQLWEYEAAANFEIQGARAIGKEPSYADPVGYSAVNSATVFARALHAPHNQDPDTVGDALVQGAQHLVDHHNSHPSSVPKVKKKKKSSDSGWTDVLKAVPAIASGAMGLLNAFF